MTELCANDKSSFRCTKCQKIFKCSHFDTSVLWEHIRNDHGKNDNLAKDKRQSVTKISPGELSKTEENPKVSEISSVDINDSDLNLTQSELNSDASKMSFSKRNSKLKQLNKKNGDFETDTTKKQSIRFDPLEISITESHKMQPATKSTGATSDEADANNENLKIIDLDKNKDGNYVKCKCCDCDPTKEKFKKVDTSIENEVENILDDIESELEVYRNMIISHRYLPPKCSSSSETLEKYPELKHCEHAPRNPNCNVVYTRRYKVNTPAAITTTSLRTPQKHNLYRTSIEKWRPANGTIYCPKCGCYKQPMIQTRTERLTNNQCGACCLLSCWPFCFIPWLIPVQDLEYLHCANCKTFLGLYDRTLNCIKPNRLFSSDDSQSSKEKKFHTQPKIDHDEYDADNEKSTFSKSQTKATSTDNKKRLPSIVIDGKELHPDVVARLQKYKKWGRLAGIDLDALTDKESQHSGSHEDLLSDTHNNKTPSIGNLKKANDKSLT